MNLKNFSVLFIATFISISANASIYEIEPNVDNCTPGKFSQAEKDKIIKLVNDIRARHKIAPIPWNEEGAIYAQAGALSNAASGVFGHAPTPGTKCHSTASDKGRDESNIHQTLRSAGSPPPTSAATIISWLKDDHPPNTATNTCTGHRRLVINPYIKSFAFGSVDAKHPTQAGTDIYAATFWGGKPSTGDNYGGNGSENDYIAYPYENYPPAWVNKANILSFHPLVDNTWYPFTPVIFTNATVTMTDENGNNVTVTNVGWDDPNNPNAPGMLRYAIIWRAVGLKDSVKYTVKINNILIGGVARNYEYWFKLTDEPPIPPNPLAAVPTLVLPANNAQNVDAPVTFKWNKSENAVSYSIQGSLVDNFMYIAFEANDLTDTTFTLSELTSNNLYFWRVAANNIDGIASDYSAVWQFRSKEILPDPPVLIYPEPDIVNENVARRVEFVWGAVNNAESYDLSVSKIISQTQADEVVFQKVTDATTYYLTEAQMLEEFTDYYFRIAATLFTGSTVWSEPVRFKTNDKISSIAIFENGTTVTCYPNPFATKATISINSISSSFVSVEIFDMLGVKVADLYSGDLDAGNNEFNFTPENLTSGVYFCKITIGKNYRIIPLNFQQ